VRSGRTLPYLAGVALASLLLYVVTGAPGLTWANDSGDGGELAVAACTLGIAHPPGYPTYLLLAYPFTRLPFGEVATRTNFFSAVCASGTAALLVASLLRRGCGAATAVAAGLALALSPLLWSQATVTEVHALNAFFTALLLFLASAPLPQSARSWPLLTAGVVWGLSLGNHPTAIFLAPLAFVVARRCRRGVLLAAAGCLAGLTVYLYLPLRAAAGPALNWGDPRTVERLGWMVSGALYRGFLFSLPLVHLPQRLLAWAVLLLCQFTPIGMLVALSGIVLLWREERRLAAAMILHVALCSFFAVVYDTTDSYLYLIPALVSLSHGLGRGLDEFVSDLELRPGWQRRAAGTLVLAIPFVLLVVRLPAMDLSDDRTPRQFEAATLQAAPPGAVIVSRQDRHTFALWYGQIARQRRPDVVVVDPALLDQQWYAARLARQLGSPRMVQGGIEKLADRLGRPVCEIEIPTTRLRCVQPGQQGRIPEVEQ